MSEVVARPANDGDRESWVMYWAKVQPQEWFKEWQYWRTEPEIPDARQRDLTARLRETDPNIDVGRYPFKGVEPKLTRADVEWLLATHENGRGPVNWNDLNQRHRWGLDLRGADLSRLNLQGLPLSRLRAGLTNEENAHIDPQIQELAAIHLEEANLSRAQLEGAVLTRAHLEAAVVREVSMSEVNLFHARLQGATLTRSRMDGADLRFAFLDNATYLRGIILTADTTGPCWLAGVRWGEADLSLVNWFQLSELADERWAKQPRNSKGERKTNALRVEDYQIALRANRKLATVLGDQGLNDESDHFAYRAQTLQRQVLRHSGWRKFGRYLFSWFLDGLAGYGYRPGRTALWYLALVLSFAVAYWLLGPLEGHPFRWDGALVFSVTSFHGRGFFPGGLALEDGVTKLAALEAVVGLLIEISFIATFTQRFFGSK